MRTLRVCFPFAGLCCFVSCGEGARESSRIAATEQQVSCDVIVAGGSTAALAAALTSAREGVRTCLLEPTDWVGGQLTASGVPAPDYAWHAVGSLSVATWAHRKENQPKDLWAWMSGIGNPGGCKVSEHCFEPKDLLATQIHPAISRVSQNLTVFRNTVVKRVETTSSGGARRIVALEAVRRTPREGVAWGGYDELFSRDVTDWYDEADSSRYAKERLVLRSERDMGPVVVDATEFGDVLALSGASYLMGSELVEGSAGSAVERCGQAMVFPFAMRLNGADVANDVPNPDSGFPRNYGFGTRDWSYIWAYRRVKGAGSVAAGDVTTQNWNPGNDFLGSYFLKNRDATTAELGDWKGGLDLPTLAAAESHAYGFYHWFRGKDPAGHPNRFSLARDVMGTGHGLSKMPYVRDTRRSIGVGGFVLKLSDMQGSASRQTGTRFIDRVGIGAYVADIHGVVNCQYAKYEIPTLPYFLPLRALTNRDVENLLVAGKTMAQSFLANSATRLHPVEMSSGVGAGAAAAHMVKASLRDTVSLVKNYGAVQSIAAKYAPINWTINGVTLPRPGESLPALGNLESGRIFCPPGAQADTVFGYCVDSENAYGPFTKAMRDKCIAQGGGDACHAKLVFRVEGHEIEVPRWGKAFTAALRGTGKCMPGAEPDGRFPDHCVEIDGGSKEIYGPFEAQIVSKCLAADGGDACYTNRWGYDFYSSLAE